MIVQLCIAHLITTIPQYVSGSAYIFINLDLDRKGYEAFAETAAHRLTARLEKDYLSAKRQKFDEAIADCDEKVEKELATNPAEALETIETTNRQLAKAVAATETEAKALVQEYYLKEQEQNQELRRYKITVVAKVSFETLKLAAAVTILAASHGTAVIEYVAIPVRLATIATTLKQYFKSETTARQDLLRAVKALARDVEKLRRDRARVRTTDMLAGLLGAIVPIADTAAGRAQKCLSEYQLKVTALRQTIDETSLLVVALTTLQKKHLAGIKTEPSQLQTLERVAAQIKADKWKQDYLKEKRIALQQKCAQLNETFHRADELIHEISEYINLVCSTEHEFPDNAHIGENATLIDEGITAAVGIATIIDAVLVTLNLFVV